MSLIKERIIGAVTVMDEKDAIKIWNMIQATFQHKEWASIPEAIPDSIDLQMLKEIESDPDCKEFISSADAMKELGL